MVSTVKNIKKFTATFKDYDNTVLQTSLLKIGDTPVYTGSTPTRPTDSSYTYTFSGWSPIINPIINDCEYVAQYELTPIEPSEESFDIHIDTSEPSSGGEGEQGTTSYDATIYSDGEGGASCDEIEEHGGIYATSSPAYPGAGFLAINPIDTQISITIVLESGMEFEPGLVVTGPDSYEESLSFEYVGESYEASTTLNVGYRLEIDGPANPGELVASASGTINISNGTLSYNTTFSVDSDYIEPAPMECPCELCGGTGQYCDEYGDNCVECPDCGGTGMRPCGGGLEGIGDEGGGSGGGGSEMFD